MRGSVGISVGRADSLSSLPAVSGEGKGVQYRKETLQSDLWLFCLVEGRTCLAISCKSVWKTCNVHGAWGD